MTADDEAPSGFPSAWYVCFFGQTRRYWWDHLSPRGFLHVLAFAYAAHAERWVIYDVGRDRTLTRVLKTEAFTRWMACLPQDRTIVHFEAGDDPAPPRVRAGFWCTTAVAHLVGVKTRALRPAALYRDLKAQGARPAFVEPDRAYAQAAAA